MERLFNLDFQLLSDAILMIIAVFVLFFQSGKKNAGRQKSQNQGRTGYG